MDDDVQVPEITKIHQRFRVGNEELGKHGHFEKTIQKNMIKSKIIKNMFYMAMDHLKTHMAIVGWRFINR